jgi:hypothetical protein
MRIASRLAISADGYVTTPDGWPWPNLEVFVLASRRPDGLRLTPTLGLDTKLTLQRTGALPRGPVEIVYSCA